MTLKAGKNGCTCTGQSTRLEREARKQVELQMGQVKIQIAKQANQGHLFGMKQID